MDKKKVIICLKKAEGQIRGIQKMIEDERDYAEILHQIATVQSATENVAFTLIENSIRVSIKRAIKNGSNRNNEVQEMIRVIKHFIINKR